MSNPARKPLRNYVFHSSVQIPHIWRNALLVLFASLGTGLGVAASYRLALGPAQVFLLDPATELPLSEVSLASILIPAVVATSFVTLGLGWLLVLAASRRIALPIFKVQRWSTELALGQLSRISFRSGDGLDELAVSCNGVLQRIEGTLDDVMEIAHDDSTPVALRQRLEQVVGGWVRIRPEGQPSQG